MSDKIELFVIAGPLERGGCERHLITILPRLCQKYTIKVFICGHTKGVWASVLEECGIEVHVLGRETKSKSFTGIQFWRIFWIFKYAFQLKKWITRNHPKIIHTFLPMPYIVSTFAMMLARYRGVFVMSRRSLNHYFKKKSFLKMLEEFCHKKINMACGNSQKVVRQLLKEGIGAEKVRCIYNGIDTSSLQAYQGCRQEVRQEMEISPDTVVIVYVANLISYKGHQDLLQAAELMVKKTHVPFQIWCIGRDDGILKNLRKTVQQLDLSQRVKFLGPCDDVGRFLWAADAGVLCSHQEGFSNSLLEKMAAGLPVVATAVGGNICALSCDSGILVQPENPLLLAEALIWFLEHPTQRRQMGKKAQQRLEEFFSLQACVENYFQLYDELITKLKV